MEKVFAAAIVTQVPIFQPSEEFFFLLLFSLDLSLSVIFFHFLFRSSDCSLKAMRAGLRNPELNLKY
jgi:hypothetical protein